MLGCCACRISAVFLSGWLCTLKAFSMERTLKRKGKFPSVASNRSMTRLPMRFGLLARCSERVLPEKRTWEGDLGCVPIHNYTMGKEVIVTCG